MLATFSGPVVNALILNNFQIMIQQRMNLFYWYFSSVTSSSRFSNISKFSNRHFLEGTQSKQYKQQ
jgi:hypothetical protein